MTIITAARMNPFRFFRERRDERRRLQLEYIAAVEQYELARHMASRFHLSDVEYNYAAAIQRIRALCDDCSVALHATTPPFYRLRFFDGCRVLLGDMLDSVRLRRIWNLPVRR